MKTGDSTDRRRFWIHARMLMVGGVLLVMLGSVVARTYYLQVVQGEELSEKAVGQHPREIKLKARRGNILDRNGVELAVTVEAPSIFARPKEIKNPTAIAGQVAEILQMPEERVLSRLRSSSPFVWLKRQTTPAEAEALKSAELKGIGMTAESKRFYPLRERAGQLLGFVGIDGRGLEGLEARFDEDLAGGEYFLTGYRDAHGRTLMTEATPEFRAFEGHSLVLTIDERIQSVAESALAEQVEKYDAKGGYAVVMDARTGEILAMANTPEFDPNRFSSHKPGDWRLRNVTDTFEPGSVFKPLVLAAAMEEGKTALGTMYDCEKGRIKIGRYTIRDSHPSDMLSAAETIKESSNICSYKIAQTIGRERFYDYIKAFGFGATTGLGVRGEQAGLVWPPDRWAEVSFANIAFGQGLTTTPLQMTNGIGAIASGGNLMQPYLVKEIRDKDGDTVYEGNPTLQRRVVSKETARDVSWAMSLVTREGGTGTQAAMEHYTVAGKTGTAQKVNPETRRYDPHMWVASFVGFVPAESPEIVAQVMIDEPQKMHYGGVVAAPAFKKIVTEALAVRGVMPPSEDEVFRFDDEQAKRMAEAAEEAARVAAEEPMDLGTMPVPRLAVVEDGQLPDFTGLSLKEALGRSRDLGLLPHIQGWGRVTSQSPSPGSPVDEETRLSLVLTPATQQALMADEPSTGARD